MGTETGPKAIAEQDHLPGAHGPATIPPWWGRTRIRVSAASCQPGPWLRSTNTETVALRISQHDEIGVVRITIPVDEFGSEGEETGRLGLLLGGVGHVEVARCRRGWRWGAVWLRSRRRFSFRHRPVARARWPTHRSPPHGARTRGPDAKTPLLVLCHSHRAPQPPHSAWADSGKSDSELPVVSPGWEGGVFGRVTARGTHRKTPVRSRRHR